MEFIANLRYARISAVKARLVADIVRGLPVASAIARLEFTPKKAAELIKKLVESALANASRAAGVDTDRLYVKTIAVDEGPTAKRWMPRAMGRATRIRKRTSHIHVALEERR